MTYNDSDPGVGQLSVLFVSSAQQDHRRLDQILGHSNWVLHHGRTLREGVDLAMQFRVPAVICDCQLPDGTWRDLVCEFAFARGAPNVIVACVPADYHLWAEAFNLGAYDVLAKPFQSDEIFRVVRSAWLNWLDRMKLRGAERSRAVGG